MAALVIIGWGFAVKERAPRPRTGAAGCWTLCASAGADAGGPGCDPRRRSIRDSTVFRGRAASPEVDGGVGCAPAEYHAGQLSGPSVRDRRRGRETSPDERAIPRPRRADRSAVARFHRHRRRAWDRYSAYLGSGSRLAGLCEPWRRSEGADRVAPKTPPCAARSRHAASALGARLWFRYRDARGTRAETRESDDRSR